MENKDTPINSRSWFCVFNNPEEHGFTGTPQEICDAIAEIWMKDNPQRTCAVNYCVSADGLKHNHAVLEDTKTMRFTVIKKLFPSMHIEPTKGNKDQAEDYINKRGKFEEKGEKILAKTQFGEIKGSPGKRRDLDQIQELLDMGKTPDEIFATSFSFRNYETMIRKEYFSRRDAETPIMRDIKVIWHVGEPGSGKSYTLVKLCEEQGEHNIYRVADYENGYLDGYSSHKTLFLDEFRGQLKFSVFLSIIDKYKSTFHARYANIKGLWNEVHISSILPPEDVYEKMVSENKNLDIYEQLHRRITEIWYHYKDANGNYCIYKMTGTEYEDYQILRIKAEEEHITKNGIQIGDLSDFENIEEEFFK